MQDIEGLTERATHLKCERCNYDLHYCPGCGKSITHAQQTLIGACDECDMKDAL